MRVPLVYQPCCPAPNCLGRQGELSENCVPNLTVRFILSRSIRNKLHSYIQTYVNLSCAPLQDIDLWEKGKQWAFSCYSPAKETACVPGIDDVSPEEMRLDAYQARTSGKVGHR